MIVIRVSEIRRTDSINAAIFVDDSSSSAMTIESGEISIFQNDSSDRFSTESWKIRNFWKWIKNIYANKALTFSLAAKVKINEQSSKFSPDSWNWKFWLKKCWKNQFLTWWIYFGDFSDFSTMGISSKFIPAYRSWKRRKKLVWYSKN